MRKILSFVSILSLSVVFFISGCSSTNQEPSGGSKKVVVWHWVTDREESFKKLAAEYEAATGVKVVFQLYAPSDIYSQKVMAAAQVQALPDIFGILGEKKVFASFIKAGHILNLSPYLQDNGGAWKKVFFPKALVVNEFAVDNPYGVDGGVFGIPLDVMNIQMVYNKSLLKKLGVNTPPGTWEEFITLCKRFKKELDIDGFASGWGETWLID
jgi:ABC-type glycerol-3-phosphate transport system substrate-binding protein